MSNWVEHTGEECPVPYGTRLDVIYEGLSFEEDSPIKRNKLAEDCYWGDNKQIGNVIYQRLRRYRIVSESIDWKHKYENLLFNYEELMLKYVSLVEETK